MERLTVEEVPELPYNPAESTRRQLGMVLNTSDISINHYVVGPGESFSSGLHRHNDQEELFYVVDGEATFDVGTEREPVTVGAGEVVRFEPGEFQEGYNDGDEPVEGLAIGAPKGTEDIDFYIECADCGTETVHDFDPRETDGRVVAVRTCGECGAESTIDLGE